MIRFRRVRAALARLVGLRTRGADEARMSEAMRFQLEQLTGRFIWGPAR